MNTSNPETCRIIFCNLDAVLGSLFTGPLIKSKYGEVDIIHQLMLKNSRTLSDVDLLNLTTKRVVSTCWSPQRAQLAAITAGWLDFRVYSLGKREH